MNNAITTKELYDRLVDFRDRRDWKKFHSPKNLAMSVSIESAELLELFQWKSDADIETVRTSEAFLADASGEIADVLIYLVLLAGDLGIDPVEAALAKTATNENRFPAEGPDRERNPH